MKKKRISGYRIARILGVDSSSVYNSTKAAKRKLRKFHKDLKDLGIQPNQIEQFLEELETEKNKPQDEPQLRKAY